ncbi:hypothetical protein BGZ65_006826 [Modicella reniformis]|uniref:Endoplasmic reticulum transmembrane protein n=1 Tax=Modicella reniformis TaxID=1440133 RepID=A0A9P6MG14_9FUNG|nr:hypothetical protein BGZ65_006826 [Modicella reniformis]
MSLFYTMVYCLLLTEMIAFIFLILPLPYKWRKGILKFMSTSRFMANIQYVMKIVFIFVFILFVDALGRVVKVEDKHNDHHSESNMAAKRFYAQRNMYLTGFTLFLSLILNRTFVMILELITSEEKMEIVKKQAAQQSKEYARVLESEKNLKEELEQLRVAADSHDSTKRDLENLKKQANQQQQEYLRLADENIELERMVKGTKAENRKDM